MKTLVKFSLLLIISTLICYTPTLKAQNYKAIKTDGEYFFLDSAQLNIIAIRIDSTKNIGDDIQYYNFKQIRQTDSGCYTLAGVSWLGDEVIEKPDGTFEFVKLPYDLSDSIHTFRIQTRSILNQPWVLYRFHTTTDYIEAKLTEIKWMSFLNLTDSVRVISLVRKNTAGQVIDDPANYQKLLISKNYGLIKLIKFDDLPYYSLYSFYDLVGKTNPETGITNLKTLQIYDFEPGDEFHTEYYSRAYIPPYPVNSITTINRVLERINYPTDDSISYLIEQCQSNCISEYESTICTHRFDTITLTYSPLKTPEFETEPLESIPYVSTTGWATNTFMGLMYADTQLPIFGTPMKYIRSSFWFTGDNGCYSQIIFDGGHDGEYYFKGLGGPYYTNTDVGWGPKNLLVYYRKSTTTWGTPLDCDSLLQLNTPEYAKNQKLNIYPNPTTSQITVSAPAQVAYPCQLEVIDIAGRTVLELTMDKPTMAFDLGNIKAGVYTLNLITGKGEIFRGKVIKQ
jgi:hypothetical protein